MKRRTFIAGLGSAAAWSLAARAQQSVVPMIGYLNSTTEAATQRFIAAFRQGLSELGYVERQNVAIEYRWMEGRYDQLTMLTSDLVHRQVAVLVAT